VLTLSRLTQAFENTSTSVAASQMRNTLNNLTDSVTDENEKARFETEIDNLGITIVSVR
jgi:UTP--glucose-1-phosphate uridylyltransferase